MVLHGISVPHMSAAQPVRNVLFALLDFFYKCVPCVHCFPLCGPVLLLVMQAFFG